ncbi:hypothetical protein HK096_002682 [Nowakowskiella sp. JEL0078]|nr:hypothetical protein HK096_002682 [Nowakowskiella sp. JEL0078]
MSSSVVSTSEILLESVRVEAHKIDKSDDSVDYISSSDDLIEKNLDKTELNLETPKTSSFGRKGLAVVILLAAAYPNFGKKGGIIRSEYTITYGVVSLIFVISGISLKTRILIKAMLNWRMHIIIQGISLGITPLLGYAMKSILLTTTFDANLAAGIAVACSTPTTISSNVLMTKNSYGSESVALTNTVIGNILGVVVSPLLVFLYLGGSVSHQTDLSSVFISLALTILVPLTVFCDTFSSHLEVSVVSLILVLILNLAYVIAVVFCSSTKTIALGIPLINVIFSRDPNIGIISTPLLMYHAEQLIFGSFLVTWFQKWSNDERDPDDDEVVPQKTEQK